MLKCKKISSVNWMPSQTLTSLRFRLIIGGLEIQCTFSPGGPSTANTFHHLLIFHEIHFTLGALKFVLTIKIYIIFFPKLQTWNTWTHETQKHHFFISSFFVVSFALCITFYNFCNDIWNLKNWKILFMVWWAQFYDVMCSYCRCVIQVTLDFEKSKIGDL